MSSSWLVYINLTVLFSILYSACFKMAGQNISAFAFALILNVSAALILGCTYVFCTYVLKMNVLGNMKIPGLSFAILAGLSVVGIDTILFLAYRNGSAVLTNTYLNVATIILFALVSLFLFHETLTLMKSLGIALGAISLILMVI